MIRKIDAVLDRVKEPESGLTLAQLGLVERFRYLERERRLLVFKNPLRPGKGCCTLVANMLLGSTLQSLIGELEKEFPHLTVEVA